MDSAATGKAGTVRRCRAAKRSTRGGTVKSRTVRQYIEDLDVDAYLNRGGKLLNYRLEAEEDRPLIEMALKTMSREDQRRIATQIMRRDKWLALVAESCPDTDLVGATLSEEDLRSLWRKSAARKVRGPWLG